jgi:dihydrofolate synthase/folylpolyglutamate synthase
LSQDSSTAAVTRHFNTLEDWLAWFETLHPKKIDFSLDRIRAVLAALGISVAPYRVVTVGGTNGKGSCVAMLERIYREAGYRVGAFTSPHLWRFNERIRLNGVVVSDEALIEIFELMEAARGEITLSYFESSAVAAMLYFARECVDVAVLEVGMGGRLDAVNVYDADTALIVSIDLDHQDYLGPDREKIGFEKAGILRAGRPAVIADRDPPQSVLTAVRERGALAKFIDRDFSAAPAAEGEAAGFVYRAPGRPERRFPRPPFGGIVQLTNAAACIAVVDSVAAVLPVADAAIARALCAVALPGRLDARTVDSVEWIFDVAHNPAAAARYRAALDALPRVPRTLAVFGAMSDKDLRGVLAPFTPEVAHWFIAAVDSERTATAAALEAVLAELGAAEVSVHNGIAAATLAARAAARAGERVLVFGSFYSVGPAMAALGLYCAPLVAE